MNEPEKQSEGGSDSQTASIASSRNTIDQKTAQSNFFVSHLPVIPFVQTIDWQYPQLLSCLGLAAEWLQVWAWAFNPHVGYGIIVHTLTHVVYASHIPVWDNASGDIGYFPSVGLIFVCILLLCAVWLWCGLGVYCSRKLSKNFLEALCRGAVHAMCSWLFIPLNSFLLAMLVCDGEGHFWTVGHEESCSGVLAVIHRLLCGLTIPALFLFCYILSSMAYDQNCFSPHLVARAHSRLEKVSVTWKVVTSVLYHTLNATGYSSIFFIYLAITTFMMAALHALFIPYFSHAVNRWKCAVYCGACWLSLVAFWTTMTEMLAFTDLDFVLIVCGLVPVCVLGTLLADIRISRIFNEWKIYFLSGSVHHTPIYEPTGIVTQSIYARYRTKGMEMRDTGLTDVFGPTEETETDMSRSGHQNHRSSAGNFMVPYVKAVYFPTDVELAARFCMYYTHWTQQTPPGRMLDHGNRLFYRALETFKTSDMLYLHAARFSCWHNSEVKTLNYVLHMYLESVSSRLRSSLEYRYQVAKLKKYVKAEIGMKDNSHIKIWGSAQKLHKEVLNQMSNFWGKLLMSQVDTLQLAVITNQITSNRQQADMEFRRVLEICKEDSVVLSYALFLEQVILDDEGADMLREQTEQASEFKRTQVDVGIGSTTHTPSSLHQSQLSELRFMLLFMSAILCAYLAGLFGYQHYLVNYEINVVDAMLHAGNVRMLAQQAGYSVAELCSLQPSCRESLFGTEHVDTSLFEVNSNSKIMTLQEELKRITADFQVQHKLLTVSGERSSFGRLVEYNTEPTAELRMNHMDGTDVDLISRAGRYLPVGLWNLGFEYAAVLRTLAADAEESTNGPIDMSTYRWIDENIGSTVTEMFDHAVRLHYEGALQVYDTHIILASVFFAVGLVILVVVYGLLISNFERIEQAKLEALNLFTLIPKPELGKLHKATKTKLQLLDQRSEFGQKGEVVSQEVDSVSTASMSDSEETNPLPTIVDKDLEFEQYVSDDEGNAKVDGLTKVTLFALLLLTISSLAISVTLVHIGERAVVPYNDEVKAYQIYENFRQYSAEMTEHVWMYVKTEDPFYIVKYSELLGDNPVLDYKKELLHLHHNLEVNYAFAEAVREHEELVAMQKIILLIAASKAGRKVPAVLSNIKWEYLDSWESKLNFFRFHLNNTTHDLSLPVEDRQLLVMQYLFDPHLTTRLDEKIIHAQEVTTNSRRESVENAGVDVLVIVMIIIWSLLILSGLFILASLKRNPVLFNKNTLVVKTILLMLIAGAGLRVAVMVFEKIDTISGTSDAEVEALRATNESLSTTMAVVQRVTAFLESNEKFYYEKFWDLVRNAGVFDTLRRMNATEAEMVEYGMAGGELIRLCRIAITLHVWANGLSMADWARGTQFPELVGTHWDLKQERGNEEVTAVAVTRAWYSTANHDALLPPRQQKRIVASILKSEKFRDTVQALRETVYTLRRRWEATNKDLHNLKDDIELLLFVCLCLSGGLFLLFGAYMISLFLCFLERNRQFSGNSSSDMGQGALPTTRSQVCLGMLALLFAGTYYLQLESLQSFKSDVSTCFYTSQREVGIARAQYLATKIAYSDEERRFSSRKLLDAKLDDIENSRAALYFGESRTSGSVNDLSSPDTIFGHNQAYDLPSCVSEQERTEAHDLLAHGVDTAMRYWIQGARTLLAVTDTTELRSQLQILTDSTDTVIFALEQSTREYNEGAKDNIWVWQQGFLALLIFTVCVVILQLLVIFRPMISQLLHQYSGTNIMLKMIPEDVRELVPVIQEYLDSGQVRDADPMELISESINEMSSVPIIAIDHLGTVIRYTQGGEAVFGWQQSEVVGSNIKLLMPPEYAKHHSQWLAQYMKTGVKKIIGTVRQVQGYRKDGVRFPMELSVREYRPPGEQPLFISTVQDLTKTFELEEARQLNIAMQQISNVPLICIDTLASITSFNAAAEQCFGVTQDEALGQNVSILMPEETAKNHDGYVAAYIKTGVKKVIDTERRATGLRKNGSVFPLVLSIKEAKLKDFGASSLFLGYVRDRTNDLVVEYQQMVRRTVTELNPLATISILDNGSVVMFPMASEELFGYKAEEVEGKNVKMLMPPEVAEKHDGYLSAYLQTGKRNVIDSTRQVSGLTKNDKELPLQLEVKEVTMKSGERSYLAFIKDLSTDLEVKLLRELNSKMVEAAPIPIVKISDVGTVLTYNHAAVMSFKFQKHEVIGQNIKLLLPPAVALEHDGYLARYKRDRVKRVIGTGGFVTTAKRSDGSTFRIRLKVDELTSQLDGTVTYMGFLYDIEEDKAMEWRSLRNDTILSSMPYSIIAIDQVGKVLVFNECAKDTWGYKASEVMGKNVKILMKETYAVKHDGYLSSYLKTGVKTVINTTRLLEAVKRDGNVFPVKLSVREYVEDSTHRIFVGYADDQTRVDTDFREKQVADALLTESPDPICKIDSFGTITQVNSSLCAFVGYSQSELIGQNVNMLMPEKIAVRHNEILAAYRRTGTATVIGVPLRQMLRKKNGSEVHISLLVHEILQDDAEPLFLGFLRDLQDVVILERENIMAEALGDLCTQPLLAIDNKGTLLKYSRAAEVCFGWKADEVLGGNVNVLMEDSIAARHDGFLRQYRKLGIKKVIDNAQRTTGKKKTGELMTLELHIKEVVSNGVSLFIGHASDVTIDLAASALKILGDSIIGRSVEPIIIMDRYGILKTFNEAACQVWGYKQEEVVGQNIKMLMHPDIAAKHDGYLATYRKTGVKTVLDSTRVLEGLTKAGEMIPVQVVPREVGDAGSEVFVAFAKPMMEELRRREILSLSEAMLSLSLLPCITIDQAGKVIMFTAAEQTLGYNEAEALGRNIKFIVPPDIAVQHDGFLKRYSTTRIKKFIGTTIRNNAVRKDGSQIPVDVSLREIVMEDGSLFFVANLRDATLDFMAQMHIQVADAIQNMSPDPMITTNLFGTVQQWNTAAERMFGWKTEEMIGANVKRITPPEVQKDHDRFLQRYRNTRRSKLVGSSRELEGWGKKEDGSEGPVKNLLVSLRLVSLEEDMVLGVIKDETHAKEVQCRMKLNNLITQNSPIAFISINDVGTVLRVNPALSTALEYSSKEVVGKNVKMLMEKEIAVHHDGYLAKYKETGIRRVIGTVRTLTALSKTGKRVVLETHISEIQVSDNSSQYMGYIRDATEDIEHINDTIISQTSQDLLTTGVIVIEVNGTVISVNNQAQELFEVAREDFVGKNVSLIMPEDTAVNHNGYLQRYLSDGIKRVVDTSRIVTGRAKRSGTCFPVELKVFECASDTQHVFVAFIEDQRRKAQLQISSELGDIILSRTPSPLIGIDGSGTIITFNKAAEAKFGFIESQMKGSNIRILMPDEIHDKHDGYIQRFIDSGCKKEGRVLFTREGMKIDAETKSGNTFTAQLRLFHIRSPDGGHIFYGCLKC